MKTGASSMMADVPIRPKSMEDALGRTVPRGNRETDPLFGTIFEFSPDVLCLVDPNGVILRMSGSLRAVLGYSPSEVAGTQLLELVHPDDAPKVKSALDAVAKREKTRFDVRFNISRTDGDWLTFATRGKAVLDDDGAPIAIAVVARDVTTEVQAEQKLLLAVSEAEQANHAKSEFLSRMSHELRTPLNSVLGFAQLLEMDELTPPQEEAVSHILRAGRHLLGLIDEVLDISRIEMGHLELTIEPVEIRSLVVDAVALTSPLADKADVSVSVTGPVDPLACVDADRQRLLQVLLNLLSNAVKYNSPGGKVRVTCELLNDAQDGRDGHVGHVGVAVSDTGVGIKDEDLSRVFEPFERLGADRIGIEGAGVGLAIAKNLVERMDGTLEVFSSLGEGSTFEVVLKRSARQLQSVGLPDEVNEVAARTKSTCVLLIEDNLANLNLIENVLTRRADVKLLAAMHGSLGVDLAREHDPDLVLLDLHLPDQTGEDVLRTLQADEKTAHIPVVVVSADRSTDLDREMRRLGAVDYLTKPFDIRDLLRCVDSALDVG